MRVLLGAQGWGRIRFTTGCSLRHRVGITIRQHFVCAFMKWRYRWQTMVEIQYNNDIIPLWSNEILRGFIDLQKSFWRFYKMSLYMQQWPRNRLKLVFDFVIITCVSPVRSGIVNKPSGKINRRVEYFNANKTKSVYNNIVARSFYEPLIYNAFIISPSTKTNIVCINITFGLCT